MKKWVTKSRTYLWKITYLQISTFLGLFATHSFTNFRLLEAIEELMSGNDLFVRKPFSPNSLNRSRAGRCIGCEVNPIAEVLYNVKNGSPFITSKSSSKILSNSSVFVDFQTKCEIKCQFSRKSGRIESVCFHNWESLTNFLTW